MSFFLLRPATSQIWQYNVREISGKLSFSPNTKLKKQNQILSVTSICIFIVSARGFPLALAFEAGLEMFVVEHAAFNNQ